MDGLLFAVILIGSIVGLGLLGVSMKFNGRRVTVYKYQKPDLTEDELNTISKISELRDIVNSNLKKVETYFKENKKLIFLEYIRKYHSNIKGENLFEEINSSTFLPNCLSNLFLFSNQEIIMSRTPIGKVYLDDVIRHHERLSGFINHLHAGKDTHVVIWKYRDNSLTEKIHGCRRVPMPKYDNA